MNKLYISIYFIVISLLAFGQKGQKGQVSSAEWDGETSGGGMSWIVLLVIIFIVLNIPYWFHKYVTEKRKDD